MSETLATRASLVSLLGGERERGCVRVKARAAGEQGAHMLAGEGWCACGENMRALRRARKSRAAWLYWQSMCGMVVAERLSGIEVLQVVRVE